MHRRAAIFDVDGTLVDSVEFHAEAWQRAFAAFGHRIAFARIRSQIGKGSDQLLPMFLSSKQLKGYGDDLSACSGAIFRSQYLARVRPFPKVRELFLRLRSAGWEIAVGSSAPAEDLEAYLKKCGVARLVKVITSADDADRSKPAPDIFQVARNRLGGLAPEHCVVIGDSPYDAIAARKAGMQVVGFLSGGSSRAQLTHCGASFIFRDPADLLRRFEESPFSSASP